MSEGNSSAASSYAMAGFSLADAFTQYSAGNAQGEFTKQAYETNARYAELEAADALKRGHSAAIQQRKRTKQLVGAQRAALAGSGVEVSSGSGLDLQMEADEMGRLDAMTIENNAFREAWGLKAQASEMRYQGKIAKSAAKFTANQTLISGGMKSIYYGSQAFGSNKIDPDANKKKAGR